MLTVSLMQNVDYIKQNRIKNGKILLCLRYNITSLKLSLKLIKKAQLEINLTTIKDKDVQSGKVRQSVAQFWQLLTDYHGQRRCFVPYFSIATSNFSPRYLLFFLILPFFPSLVHPLSALPVSRSFLFPATVLRVPLLSFPYHMG